MSFPPTRGVRGLIRQFHAAQRETGISAARLFADAVKLRRGASRVGFSEYFGYALYDPRQVAPGDAASFAGVALAEQIWNGLNPRHWWGLAMDKVAYQRTMQALGFRQPRLKALYAADGRTLPDLASFRDVESMLGFLRDVDNYPMFAKPNDALRSFGAVGLQAYERASDTVRHRNGEVQPLAELAARIGEWNSYLFQDCLQPHPLLSAVSGVTLSTLRVVILIGDNGPELFRVIWKIPQARNVADNFWRSGNVIGRVDTRDGRVVSMLRSVDGGHRRLTPDDALAGRFIGKPPPLYHDAIALAFDASRVFTMLAYQAWDIALTADGPVALELNHDGDIELLQIGASVGILDRQFRRLLRERGVRLGNRR